MSLYLARDLKNGFTEQVCPRCRAKGHITCPCCGKHRRPEGLSKIGRIVCKKCVDIDGDEFICPKCGQPGRRHSSKSCDTCYWKERLTKKVRDATAMLNHQWTRDALNGFINELADRRGPFASAVRIERYFLFFAKLDAEYKAASELDMPSLARIFGAEGLRRHAVPYGYIVKTFCGHDAIDFRATLSAAKYDATVEAAAGEWFGDVVAKYHGYRLELNGRYVERGWVGKRSRFTMATIKANLAAAVRFLQSLEKAGITTISQIEQHHLDRFLTEKPGYSGGIRSFVRYLNRKERLFRKIKVVSVKRNLPPGSFLPRERFDDLLREWLNPDDIHLKEALICLMMLLYAQQPRRLLRLKMTDIMHGRDGSYRLLFGPTEITLPPEISELMGRYLRNRRALATMEDDWESPWLFPGRSHGDHLNTASVSYYLKKAGVSVNQLFSTAVYNAYASGLRHPKVLVRAFGITTFTAVKYLALIDPRLRDQVEQRMLTGG